MNGQMDMVFMIILALVIGLLVFTQIIPFATRSMETASEPLPGMEAKLRFDALVGSAFTINTYTFATAMPRDYAGNLEWDAVNSMERGRAEKLFQSEMGQTFTKLLVETQYLKKHMYQCLGGCSSLSECDKVGESIYGTSPTITEENAIKTALKEVAGDCMRVADYLVRKNQYLAKQAEVTSGALSTAWTDAPP